MAHPRFKDAMSNFKFNVKNKNVEGIVNVKDFNLKNLELLYLIDYCISLKNCKVVYARKQAQAYVKMDEAYKGMTKEQRISAADSKKAKIEDYTDILINQMKPTLKFALSPESPFKHIVGIVQPDLVEGVSKRWK